MTFNGKERQDIQVVLGGYVIGEASKNMPKKIKDKYPLVPWDEMYLMRNKISHEYFGVDYEILWDVASNYLPENKSQIEDILKKEQ